MTLNGKELKWMKKHTRLVGSGPTAFGFIMYRKVQWCICFWCLMDSSYGHCYTNVGEGSLLLSLGMLLIISDLCPCNTKCCSLRLIDLRCVIVERAQMDVQENKISWSGTTSFQPHFSCQSSVHCS